MNSEFRNFNSQFAQRQEASYHQNDQQRNPQNSRNILPSGQVSCGLRCNLILESLKSPSEV